MRQGNEQNESGRKDGVPIKEDGKLHDKASGTFQNCDDMKKSRFAGTFDKMVAKIGKEKA